MTSDIYKLHYVLALTVNIWALQYNSKVYNTPKTVIFFWNSRELLTRYLIVCYVLYGKQGSLNLNEIVSIW